MRSNRFRPILEPVDRRVLLSISSPIPPGPGLPAPEQSSIRFSADRYDVNPAVPSAPILVLRSAAWKDQRKTDAKALPGGVQAEFWTVTTDSAGHARESAHQPVTFGRGRPTAVLRVPTHPEGDDVPAGSTTVLHLKPLTPGAVAIDPARFQVDPVDSRATLTLNAQAPTTPPRVVSYQATSRGVVIDFDRPVNRGLLSDPRHYSVEWKPPFKPRTPSKLEMLVVSMGGDIHLKSSPPSVPIPIVNVEVSPDDRSVTLVAARKLDLSRAYSVDIDAPLPQSGFFVDGTGPLLSTHLEATRRMHRRS